jgi:putative effector of murein hydrolase LrgA (UPF0299 family)
VNAPTINFIFAAVGAIGLFFLVGGITGRIRISLAGRPGTLGRFEEGETPMRLPLAARLAQSITEALPFGSFGLGEEPLEASLTRAGNPYDSPLQFYQRKLAYMGLYAVGAVVLGVLAGLPIPLTLLAALIAGVFGLLSPESVIADRIQKRRDELRREMAFMLDRVGFAVMAYGTLQETLSQMSALMGPEVGGGYRLPFEERAQVTRKFERVGKFRRPWDRDGGDGRGPFCGIPQSAGNAAVCRNGRWLQGRARNSSACIRCHQVTSFLDVVEAGSRAPMAERLFRLADDMVERSRRINGRRACAPPGRDGHRRRS